MPLLSVLILSVLGRRPLLSELLLELTQQIKANRLNKDVEILVYLDDMEHSIPDKRNELLRRAKGKMVVYLDDDDMVSKQYLKLITDVIRGVDVDYIGYKVKLTEDGVFTKPTYHSITYKGVWSDQNGYYRHVAHINPIKTEIAKKYRFPRVHRSEDDIWDWKIFKSGKLKREFYIDEFMYFYRFVKAKSLATTLSQKENGANQVYKRRVKDFDRSLVTFVDRRI